MHFTIVFDIGGTYFRVGLLNSKGQFIFGPKRFFTPNYINHKSFSTCKIQSILIDKIINHVNKIQKKFSSLEIKTIGISFPGPTNDKGDVLNAPTIWGADRKSPLKLKDILEQYLPGMHIEVVNDLTAAAVRYEQRAKKENLSLIEVTTISSGIGSKIYDVKDNNILLDPNGFGGELGHASCNFSDNPPLCQCGLRGHLMSFATGRAAEKIARQLAKKEKDLFKKSPLYKLTKGVSGKITNKKLAQIAKTKDPFVLKILNYVTAPLANVLAFHVKVFGVEKIIIIGGFALGVGRPYLQILRQALKKQGINNANQLIDFGQNDDNHSLIGIGLLVQKKFQNYIRKCGVKYQTKKDGTMTIKVKFQGPKNIQIKISSDNILDQKNQLLWSLLKNREFLICVDKSNKINVEKYFNRHFPIKHNNIFVEKTESIASVLKVCKKAKQKNYGKKVIFVAIGNSKVKNVTGLAASLYRRGVDWLYIPTHADVLDKPPNKISPAVKFKNGFLKFLYPPKIILLSQSSKSLPKKPGKIRFVSTITLDKHINIEIVDLHKQKVRFRAELPLERNLAKELAFIISQTGLAIGVEKFFISGASQFLQEKLKNIFIKSGVFGLSKRKISEWIEFKKGKISHRKLIAEFNSHYEVIQETPNIKTYNYTLSKDINYSVIETQKIFSKKNKTLQKWLSGKKHIAVCVDEELPKKWKKQISTYFRHKNNSSIIKVATGEKNKNINTVLKLCEKLQDKKVSQNNEKTIFLAIGGGIVTDIASLAAGVYGIQYIRIPTTILGIVDAAIGVKSGVSFEKTKNFLGLFDSPLAVIWDPNFITTLEEREIPQVLKTIATPLGS